MRYDNDSSLSNLIEAEFIINHLKKLLEIIDCILFFSLVFFKLANQHSSIFKNVGIITPYKAQQALVISLLKLAFGEVNTSYIEVDTVDAYQGREKDIIIMSCGMRNI